MIYLFSILLGFVQGITEFLPVSSSGHLVILHEVLNFSLDDNLIFDVSLHLGTLLALIVYFFKDIIIYFKAFLKSFLNWDLKNNLDQRISWYILISMIPAAFVGYFFEEVIENLFRSTFSVAIVLILVSFLFILAEKYSAQNKDFNSLTWVKSLIIGIAQAFALIPGVSRSGITIVSGMLFNLSREKAARFSFIMAIPIVFAAGTKKSIDAFDVLARNEIYLIIIGFIVSAIVGYFAIKYFLKFVQKYSLNWFAGYRITLGLIILIYIFLK